MALRTTIGDRRRRGSTLIAVLIVLTIVGVGCAVVAQAWSLRIRRENEEELLFRGQAIAVALDAYAKATPPGASAEPARLEDLLADPRVPYRSRYLRTLYDDPVAHAPFDVLRDAQGGIVGVASVSDRQPLKRADFPACCEAFATAKTYRDWRFMASNTPSQ